MCGIWKISDPNLDLPDYPNEVKKKSDIVVRLNEDGTFDPYTPEPTNEGPHDLNSILGRGGCWEYRDDTLILAADRPEDADPSKIHDTLLKGKLSVKVSKCLAADDEGIFTPGDDSATGSESEKESTSSSSTNDNVDVHLSIAEGQVSIGKFMYPKKHKAFFDEPVLFKKSNVGTFHMNQLLGNLNARLKTQRDAPTKPEAKFHKNDFYNRTFYLTATTHPVNEQYAKNDIHYDESKALLDIRVMPVTFHPNNTFTAIGTEKILRGRYGIAGEHRDRLWFQVSLFGAGRSAPGSVYSEGRLVSHDDRRGYSGSIQSYEKRNQTLLFVEGEFYYGTDLKRAWKPNSMGTFSLQEVDYHEDEEDDDEEDEEAEDIDFDWDGQEDAFQ